MSSVRISVRLEDLHQRMQFLETWRDASIDFPHHDGRAIAVHDLARPDPVGPEIDEGADGSLLAHDAGDDVLAKPVLQRHHVAVVCQMRQQRPHGLFGMMCFHRQEDALPPASQRIRREGRRRHHHRIDGSGDLEPASRITDRGHVIRHDIDECHVLTGALQGRAESSADRAGSPDQNWLCHW